MPEPNTTEQGKKQKSMRLYHLGIILMFFAYTAGICLAGYAVGSTSNPFLNHSLKHSNFYYLYTPNTSAANSLIPNESFIVNQSVVVKCFSFTAKAHSPINCTKAQYIVNNTLPNGMIYMQLQNTSNFSMRERWSP